MARNSKFDPVGFSIAFTKINNKASDGFIDYYSYVRESIRFKTDTADYLSKMKNSRRLAYAYMDELWEIESATRLSFSIEIERCFLGLEEQIKETYADRVAGLTSIYLR